MMSTACRSPGGSRINPGKNSCRQAKQSFLFRSQPSLSKAIHRGRFSKRCNRPKFFHSVPKRDGGPSVFELEPLSDNWKVVPFVGNSWPGIIFSEFYSHEK